MIILLGGLMHLAAEVNHATTTASTVIVLALGALGTYSLYRSLRHDMGPVFRIPYTRIRALEDPGDGMLTIRFLDRELKEDQVTVRAPEQALLMIREGLDRSRS
jgi:hypothetical protein